MLSVPIFSLAEQILRLLVLPLFNRMKVRVQLRLVSLLPMLVRIIRPSWWMQISEIQSCLVSSSQLQRLQV